MSARAFAGRLLVLVCASLLAFLAAEGLARLFLPAWAPRTAALSTFWRYDPRYGWSHIPRTRGRFTAEEGKETTVAINSRGFRGPDWDYARNGVPKRVLVLGDSMAWGFGVEYDETFGALLERLVPSLEVVNLAVSGYSTDQELLLYRDEGHQYQADLVLVVVAANDLASNTRTVEYLIYGKPAFAVRGRDLELVNQPVAKVSWMRRSAVQIAWRSYVLTELQRYLYSLEEGRASAKRAQLEQAPDGAGDVRQVFLRSTTWQLTTKLLREFKHETSRRGSELLVVFVDGVYASREAARYLREFDIDSLVLDDHLDNSDKRLHLADGIHWSPEGHKVVAAILARNLMREHLK